MKSYLPALAIALSGLTTALTSAQSCEDSSSFRFDVKAPAPATEGTITVACDWLTEDGISAQQVNNRFSRWCEGSAAVNNNCAKTCGSCGTGNCGNTDGFQFEVFTTTGGNKKNVGCGWIVEEGITAQQRSTRYNKFCVDDANVSSNCADTCRTCDQDVLATCPVIGDALLGNGECQGGAFNTLECGYDNGDCSEFNAFYPNCNVDFPSYIGDGNCDGLTDGPYNTIECGFDGGDCEDTNAKYPNCPFPNVLGDGTCDTFANTTQCGWDDGDCGTNSPKKSKKKKKSKAPSVNKIKGSKSPKKSKAPTVKKTKAPSVNKIKGSKSPKKTKSPKKANGLKGKKNKCKNPKGSKKMSSLVQYTADTVNDAICVSSNSTMDELNRRRGRDRFLETMSKIISADIEAGKKVDEACESSCVIEAKAEAHYVGFDNATDAEILSAFGSYLNEEFPGLSVTASESKADTDANINNASVNTQKSESKTVNPASYAAPIACVALIAIGAAFFMKRRSQSRRKEELNEEFHEGIYEERFEERIEECKPPPTSDISEMFPIKSNKENDEYEVTKEPTYLCCA